MSFKSVNRTKVPYLGELSLESDPLFICLTETHLSEDILPAEVHINNYRTPPVYSKVSYIFI